jgi:hypothetical protein
MAPAMQTILLNHDPRLTIHPESLYRIPKTWSPPADCSTVLACRPWEGHPATPWGPINATTRFQQDFGPHICCHSLEEDTILAPLILWDLAHKLPLQGRITLANLSFVPYLDLPYFRHALAVETRNAQQVTYRKIQPLLIEHDRGLTRWSFGLPTGPGDATGLNVVVARILELGIPEFEIILCGRPGPNFKYFDRVRIVGEELSKPPVLIGKKKNVLAQAAQYENLCILHDRVFLPSDFYQAVTRFGDDYPMTTLQSLWFDDPYNLIVKRYSDYNRVRNGWTLSHVKDPIQAENFFARDYFTIEPNGGFYYAHPLRYTRTNYCNGSLYLSKRSLWQNHPQSDVLLWAQYEDVEHGLRLSEQGIPSRVNPYAFSQSIFARISLLNPAVLFESPGGGVEQHLSPLEAVKFRRKPLIRWSNQEAQERLMQFAKKYVPDEFREHVIGELNKPCAQTLDWVRKIAVVIYASNPRFGEEAATEYINDAEKWIIGDNIHTGGKRFFLESFAIHGPRARDHFVENSGYIRNMVYYRRYSNMYYDSLAEYFPEDTWKLRWGTRWTARRLARHNGALFVHPDGKDGYEQAILNSTPFRKYYEAAV